VLEKLAAEANGEWVLAKVDTDQNQNLAQYMRVEGIPAVFLIAGGAIAGHFVGALSEPQARQFLKEHLPSEADRIALRAVGMEADDAVGATRMYEQALLIDPKHGPSLAGLAALALVDGDSERAAELVKDVERNAAGGPRAEMIRAQLQFVDAAREAGPIHLLEARCAREPASNVGGMELGIAYAAAGRFPEALEKLVGVIERDRKFGEEKVRPVVLQIFQVLGPDSELANQYRARLQNALY
ncbi:MAG TPA: tetratricopeptide repeat protein, partial [Planctomycetia bacterium]|nr:tetratricopeptide repeat protein [Planctomycetia bacterium]